MTYILAGDVGGTKTLLSLLQLKDREMPEVVFSQRYWGKEYSNLTAMITDFLAACAPQTVGANIAMACLGIAGPVAHNTSYLTNLQWSIDAQELSQALNIDRVILINDFEAIGYGVLGLQTQDLYTLQVGEPNPTAPIGIIGAGTGLGEGFLIWDGQSYQVYPSEGGHVDFAPRSEVEDALLQYLRNRYGRISVERVVSGRGIVNIYQFLQEYHTPLENSRVAAAIQLWEKGDPTIDPGATIAQAAFDRTDRLAVETIALFLEAYASEVGNLALKLLPFGGLYIAGGIMPKLMPLMVWEKFLESIKAKGRVSPILDRVPLYVVLNPSVGLIGAGLYGSRLCAAGN